MFFYELLFSNPKYTANQFRTKKNRVTDQQSPLKVHSSVSSGSVNKSKDDLPVETVSDDAAFYREYRQRSTNANRPQ